MCWSMRKRPQIPSTQRTPTSLRRDLTMTEPTAIFFKTFISRNKKKIQTKLVEEVRRSVRVTECGVW